MSEGIAPRGLAPDWTGRLVAWRRRHGVHVAAAMIFAVTCILGMAATSIAFDAFVGALG